MAQPSAYPGRAKDARSAINRNVDQARRTTACERALAVASSDETATLASMQILAAGGAIVLATAEKLVADPRAHIDACRDLLTSLALNDAQPFAN